MKDTKDYLDSLIYILKSNNVNLETCDIYFEDYENKEKCDKQNEWIKDVYLLTNKHLKTQRKAVENSVNNFFISSCLNEDIKKYLCLFPENSLIINGSFADGFTGKGNFAHYTISKEYLINLLNNRELIEHGIINIVPNCIEHYEDGQGYYDIDTIEKRFVMGLNSPPKYLLNEKGTYIQDSSINKMYFNFPWLYGASIDDYISIVSKNKTLFCKYQIEVDKFISDIKNGREDFVIKEIQEAHINIQIEFEKAQEQLKSKGKKSIIGIALTFIPILLPIESLEMKQMLSLMLGATNLKLISDDILEQKGKLKEFGRTNPLWISWQWKRLYERQIKR